MFLFLLGPLSAQIDFRIERGLAGPSLPAVHCVGDFNGDSFPDIAGQDLLGLGFGFLINRGDATFDDRASQVSIGTITSMTAADLDGDGDVDIVATDATSVRVFSNSGGLTFTETFSSTVRRYVRVVLADLDGDGRDEIVAQSGAPQEIELFENLGGGTFRSNQVLAVPALIDFVVADVDGDGDIDVVTTDLFGTGNAVFLLNNGGTLQRAQGPSLPSMTWVERSADIDGDGDSDFITLGTGAFGPEVGLLRNQGASTFVWEHVAVAPVGITAVADFDADGDLDVVGRGQSVVILENSGAGLFHEYANASDPTSGGFPSQRLLVPADFDQDGDLDIATDPFVFASQGAMILVNQRVAKVVHVPFNEVRGFASANLGPAGFAEGSLYLSRPNWQSDPGRVGFRGNDPGSGCLNGASGSHAHGIIHREVRGDLTIMWWQRVVGPAPSAVQVLWHLGSMVCEVGGTSGGSLLFAPSYQSATNVVRSTSWVHVALTIDALGRAQQFYIQGVRDPNQGGPAFPQQFTLGSFAVGARRGGTGQASSFEIDDFRVYTRVLAEREIRTAMGSEENRIVYMGEACTGPLGRLSMMVEGVPDPGNFIRVGLRGATLSGVSFLILGASLTRYGVLSLPIDLGFGCELQVSPEVILPASLQTILQLPAGGGMREGQVYAQFIAFGGATSVSDVAGITVRY